MLILVHINENRHIQNSAFFFNYKWIETIVVTPFVQFVYYDIQLTKMNK